MKMMNFVTSKGKKHTLSPKARFVEFSEISRHQAHEMYAIYEKYYENTNFPLFWSDLSKKTGAILIFHPTTNVIVGFSTIAVHHFKLENKNYTTVFSGDTVIEKEFWGSRALIIGMTKFMVKLRFKHPTDKLYWVLISKGYKTYLLLANNYYTYYPHVDGKHTELAPIIEHYCEQYFPKYYDDNTGLLNFGEDYQPLKGEVAPITEKMRRRNRKIKFFEEMNPSWKAGTELPCIGEISWSDLLLYPTRLFSKPVSQGKREAIRSLKCNNSVGGTQLS